MYRTQPAVAANFWVAVVRLNNAAGVGAETNNPLRANVLHDDFRRCANEATGVSPR